MNTVHRVLVAMMRPFWKMRAMAANPIRGHKTAKAIGRGDIPGWWDFDQDCGYSDKWYKCRWCYVCTTPRWIPKGITK
jgi:hypothetical protein